MLKNPDPAPPRRIAGLGAVAPGYDLLLSDIWGVVHNGREHFVGAVDALRRFRAGGGRVVLLTNAPRPHGSVIAQLDGLAVPRDAYDGVVTSGDVAAALILERGGAPLLHLGPDRDLALYDEVERVSGRPQPRVTADAAEFCVCTGLFDDETETPDDYAAIFETMRARDMPMICANPDLVVHRGEDEVYCAGALAARYGQLGGQVIQAGKPYAPIYAMALRAAGGTPAKTRIAAVGDAMATDIRGALDLGVDAIFVTGGIHRAAFAAGPDAAAHFYAEAGFAPQMALPALVW